MVIRAIIFCLMSAILGVQLSAAEAGNNDDLIQPASPQERGLASQTDSLAHPSSSSAITKMVIYLFLIGGGLYIYWRLSGRKFSLRGGPANATEIDIRETRMLGNRQYLVLVECDGRRLLLGVGPGSIEHLCFLDEKQPRAIPGNPSFATTLESQTGGSEE